MIIFKNTTTQKQHNPQKMHPSEELINIQKKREELSKEVQRLETERKARGVVKVSGRYVPAMQTEAEQQARLRLKQLNEREKTLKQAEHTRSQQQIRREERRELVEEARSLKHQIKQHPERTIKEAEEKGKLIEQYKQTREKIRPTPPPKQTITQKHPAYSKPSDEEQAWQQQKKQYAEQQRQKFEAEFYRKQKEKAREKASKITDVPIIQFTKEQKRRYRKELEKQTKDKTEEELLEQGIIRKTTPQDTSLAPYRLAYTEKAITKAQDTATLTPKKYFFKAEKTTLKTKIRDTIKNIPQVLVGAQQWQSQKIQAGLDKVGLTPQKREQIYEGIGLTQIGQPLSPLKHFPHETTSFVKGMSEGIITKPFVAQTSLLVGMYASTAIGLTGKAAYGTAGLAEKAAPSAITTTAAYVTGKELLKGTIAMGLKYGVPTAYAMGITKRVAEQPTKELRIQKTGEVFGTEILPFGAGTILAPKTMPGRNILEEGAQIRYRNIQVQLGKEKLGTVFRGITYGTPTKETPLIGAMGGHLVTAEQQITFVKSPKLIIGKGTFVEKLPKTPSGKPGKYEIVSFEQGMALESPLQTQILTEALPTYTPVQSMQIGKAILKAGYTGIPATKEAVTRTQEFFGGGTATLKSEFVQPKYTREVKAFEAAPEGVKDVLDFTKAYEGYTYGSSAAKSQAPTEAQLKTLAKQEVTVPGEPLRPAADIDVMFDTKTTAQIEQPIAKELVPALKERGLPFKVSKENPLLIETTRPDLPSHAVDIHTTDTAAEDIISPAFAKETFLGHSLHQPRIKVEGYETQPLSEQLLRKAASTLTLRSAPLTSEEPTIISPRQAYFFAPEKHRGKDILDWFEEGENLLLSYAKKRGDVTSRVTLARKQKQLSRIKEMYDPKLFREVKTVSDRPISKYKPPKSRSIMGSVTILPQSFRFPRSKRSKSVSRSSLASLASLSKSISKSLSPSISVSPSLSVSPSIKSSRSPSKYPSVSVSPSPSFSKSLSPSRSKSPSRSFSPSPSPSPYSSYSFASPSPPPSTPPFKKLFDIPKIPSLNIKKVVKPKKGKYRPTVFSISLGYRKPDLPGGTLSGLGLRPLQ